MANLEQVPVLVITDQPALCAGFRSWWNGEGRYRIVAQVANKEQCVAKLNTDIAVALAMVDLKLAAGTRLDDTDAFDTVRWLRKYRLAMKVLAMGYKNTDDAVLMAYQCQAHGLLCCTAPEEDFDLAARQVLRGGIYHTARSNDLLLNNPGALTGQQRLAARSKKDLTDLDLGIFEAMGRLINPTYEAIAQELGQNRRAIEYRVGLLFTHFGVNSKPALLSCGIRMGVVKV